METPPRVAFTAHGRLPTSIENKYNDGSSYEKTRHFFYGEKYVSQSIFSGDR